MGGSSLSVFFQREDFERLKRQIVEAAKHNAKAVLYGGALTRTRRQRRLEANE